MREEGLHKRALTPMPGSERRWLLSFDMQSHPQALQPTQDKTRQDKGAYTDTGGAVAADRDKTHGNGANNLKIIRSKAAFNLLFWSEVVKTMSVSGDKISISLV